MADGNQIVTSVSIISSLLGFQAISLTDFSTSALSSIAAGSKVEIAGAFFTFNTDCVPNATSWTSILDARTAYLALTPSGTAGSQIVSASWLDQSPAPVWSDSKQGWYASAASNIRIIASAWHTSDTQQDKKVILSNKKNENWDTALNSELGVNWNIALLAALASSWLPVIENDLGSGWSTTLANQSFFTITHPIPTAGSAYVGQLYYDPSVPPTSGGGLYFCLQTGINTYVWKTLCSVV